MKKKMNGARKGKGVATDTKHSKAADMFKTDEKNLKQV